MLLTPIVRSIFTLLPESASNYMNYPWSIAVNLPAGLKSDRWNVKKEENDRMVLLQIKFHYSEMVEQPSTQITEDEAKLYDRQIRYNILDGMKNIL